MAPTACLFFDVPICPTVYPRQAFCRVRMVVMICQPRPTLNYSFPGLESEKWKCVLPILVDAFPCLASQSLCNQFCKEGFQSVSWPRYFLSKSVGSKNRRNMGSKNPELWIHMNPHVLLGQYWFWYLLVVFPKEPSVPICKADIKWWLWFMSRSWLSLKLVTHFGFPFQDRCCYRYILYKTWVVSIESYASGKRVMVGERKWLF